MVREGIPLDSRLVPFVNDPDSIRHAYIKKKSPSFKAGIKDMTMSGNIIAVVPASSPEMCKKLCWERFDFVCYAVSAELKSNTGGCFGGGACDQPNYHCHLHDSDDDD